MMIRTMLISGLLSVTAVSVSAETRPPNLYAYDNVANFCPAGLQPVTIDGTICCGTPNQSLTYQQVMTHPVQKRYHQPRKVRHRPAGIPLKGNDVYMGKGID